MYPTFEPEAEDYKLALEVCMSIPEECTANILSYYQDARQCLEKETVDGDGFKDAVKVLRLAIADELMINAIRENMGFDSMGRIGSSHVH